MNAIRRDSDCQDQPASQASGVLDALWAPARRFLGCRVGILGGAMSWVSDDRLVAAISDAGAFGVYAASAMPPAQLRDGIEATQARTDAPFGVNLITFHPEFEQLIEVCIETGVRHVILGGGLPSGRAVERLKRAGAGVVCFAASIAMARRAVRIGADALIVEGMEAGGHVGPVSTSVLAQEILPQVGELPVFVAGGIGRGEAIAAYLVMGAAGCQIGTRFACATESPAHPRFKQALIRARSRDAVVSSALDPKFRVIPVRALANRAMDRFRDLQRDLIERLANRVISGDQAQQDVEGFWAGRLRRAVIEGDVDDGSLMAGQSVAMVEREQSAAEIIDELIGQAARAFDRLPAARGVIDAETARRIRRELLAGG